LFGIGFAVIMSRAVARRAAFHRFYLRRAGLLFAIGAAHAIFFWHNDILAAYAVCGVLLLPFVSARDRTVLMLAGLAFLAPVATSSPADCPWAFSRISRTTWTSGFGFTRDARIETWTRGTPGDIVRLNLAQVVSQVSFYAATFESGSWTETLSGTFGILPLSAGYVTVCCLLWLDARGRGVLRHLPVRRMALTNYVGQSVVCMLIFRAPGLALGGTLGPTLYLPIGFAIYAVQVAIRPIGRISGVEVDGTPFSDLEPASCLPFLPSVPSPTEQSPA
jgi:uncharacterized protein